MKALSKIWKMVCIKCHTMGKSFRGKVPALGQSLVHVKLPEVSLRMLDGEIGS